MTKKFDDFVIELKQLCSKHGVHLAATGYEGLAVFDLHEDRQQNPITEAGIMDETRGSNDRFEGKQEMSSEQPWTHAWQWPDGHRLDPYGSGHFHSVCPKTLGGDEVDREFGLQAIFSNSNGNIVICAQCGEQLLGAPEALLDRCEENPDDSGIVG